MLQVLVEHGANVNVLEPSDRRTTPLHNAAMSPSMTKTVEYLLEQRADVHATDGFGHTGLHVAVNANALGNMRALLQHGSNIHARDKRQSTPLHIAVKYASIEGVELLLQQGSSAEVNAKDSKHRTPLHLAAQHVELQFMQVFTVVVSDDLELTYSVAKDQRGQGSAWPRIPILGHAIKILKLIVLI